MFVSPGVSPDTTETGRVGGPSRRINLGKGSVRVRSPRVTKSFSTDGASGRYSPEKARERRDSAASRNLEEGGELGASGASDTAGTGRAPAGCPGFVMRSRSRWRGSGVSAARRAGRAGLVGPLVERSRWRVGGLSPTRSRHCGFPVGSGLGGGVGRTGPRSICGYNDQRLETRPSQRLYLEMGGSL